MYSRPVPHLIRRREGVFITLVADRGPRREGRPELCGERGAGPDLRAPAVDEASLGRRFHDFHADVARCITEIDGPQFDVAALLGDRLGFRRRRDDGAPDLYRDVRRKRRGVVRIYESEPEGVDEEDTGLGVHRLGRHGPS